MRDHYVECGDIKLRLRLDGDQGPWVIFLSAFPGMALDWSLVQPKVAAFARTLSYDRAGMGKSSPFMGRVKKIEHYLAELNCITSELTPSAPIILVGHSIGGVIARQFYNSKPENVSSLVLLDSSHEQQRHRLPGIDVELQAMEHGLKLQLWLARLGVSQLLTRIQGHKAAPTAFRELPPVALSEWLNGVASLKQSRASLAEFYGLLQLTELVPPDLGDLPLLVLEIPQSTSPYWHELQLELASLSNRSELRIIEDSGHYIQLESPTSVVEAIREVVENLN